MTDLYNPFSLTGKTILVTGILNKDSIATACAKVLIAMGARVFGTFQDINREIKIRRYTDSIGILDICPCDVSEDESIDALAEWVSVKVGKIDGLVHSIAYAEPDELTGTMLESTTRDGFAKAMSISSYSFIALVNRLVNLINEGGKIGTMTFIGARRPVDCYNVMGPAKAALEAAVRAAAVELGPLGICVNGISASPLMTTSGRGVDNHRYVGDSAEAMSPLGIRASHQQIGMTAGFLMCDVPFTGAILEADYGIGVPAFPPWYNAKKTIQALNRVKPSDVD